MTAFFRARQLSSFSRLVITIYTHTKHSSTIRILPSFPPSDLFHCLHTDTYTQHAKPSSTLSNMEAGGVLECLKDKNILVTGCTGFLAKIFVEKVLRVQPNVKKLFLLVRAKDNTSAMNRVQTEVVGKELFKILKESHGNGFHSFIAEKLFPIAGDVIHENLGIGDSNLVQELRKKIDIVVNAAATTNFDERYDVALGINVIGAKHVLEFAKKCVKLEMLLHVSSAFVAGMKEGLILEKAFHMGETLKENSYLDIERELMLVEEKKRELHANKSMENDETIAMKEMGMERAKYFGWPNTYVYTKAMGEMLLGHLRGDLPLVILRPTIITSIYKEPLPGWIEGSRTIDIFIIGYAKGKISCFFGNPELIADVVPGDMVVNAMIVTMAAHRNQRSEFIYHMSSGVRNPVTYATLEQCGFRYFLENPRRGKDGKTIKTKRISVFKTVFGFHGYMTLRYRLPLEGLHLINLALCRLFDSRYKELRRKFNFVMHLVDLYTPYAFFKGCFDDINMERLRMTMMKDDVVATSFNFDPKSIDWKDYFYGIHIPGVLKYVCK